MSSISNEYVDCDDWYDHGPGSESFKRLYNKPETKGPWRDQRPGQISDEFSRPRATETKKYTDLDKEGYERSQDELSAQANVYGLGMWDKPGSIMREDLADIYGICATCSGFIYMRREFGEPVAGCRNIGEQIMRLSGKARMVECHDHSKRSMLTLAQMMDIAFIIESPKRRVGF